MHVNCQEALLKHAECICVFNQANSPRVQAITLKLKSPVELEEIERLIRNHNEWVDLVPNTKDETLQRLTPCAVAGGLKVAVGRVRRMAMGDKYLTVFTVGDQLLWGAAEPVRRALQIVLGHISKGQ